MASRTGNGRNARNNLSKEGGEGRDYRDQLSWSGDVTIILGPQPGRRRMDSKESQLPTDGKIAVPFIAPTSDLIRRTRVSFIRRTSGGEAPRLKFLFFFRGTKGRGEKGRGEGIGGNRLSLLEKHLSFPSIF